MNKKAIIYNVGKSATQSGYFNSDCWMLEFVPEASRYIYPIMGWTGNSDTSAMQIKLKFTSKEEAMKYADNNKINYFVYEAVAPDKTKAVKPYLNNFK